LWLRATFTWVHLYKEYSSDRVWSPDYVDLNIDGFKYYMKVNCAWPSYAVTGIWVFVYWPDRGEIVAATGWIYYHRIDSGWVDETLGDTTWGDKTLYWYYDDQNNEYFEFETGQKYQICIELQHITSGGVSYSDITWGSNKEGLAIDWIKLKD